MSYVADDFAAIARRQRELGAVSDSPAAPAGYIEWPGPMDEATVARFKAEWSAGGRVVAGWTTGLDVGRLDDSSMGAYQHLYMGRPIVGDINRGQLLGSPVIERVVYAALAKT